MVQTHYEVINVRQLMNKKCKNLTHFVNHSFYFYSQAAISFLTITHLLYLHAYVMKASNWWALGYNEQKYTAITAPYACTTLFELPIKKSSAASHCTGQACRVSLTLMPIRLRRAKTSNSCDLWVAVIYFSCWISQSMTIISSTYQYLDENGS